MNTEPADQVFRPLGQRLFSGRIFRDSNKFLSAAGCLILRTFPTFRYPQKMWRIGALGR